MPLERSLELKHGWEHAEIVRSDVEARLTSSANLLADRSNLARYLAPPLDTVYPLEYAFALLGDIRGRRVLDFGCGSGENSLLLANRGAQVIGVDISASLIALARRRLAINGVGGDARYLVGSAHDLPLADGSADAVLGIAILHHLDLDGAAREIHRVLKPGGLAIFKEPVRDSRLVRRVRSWIPYTAPDVSPFERPLTSAELTHFSARFHTVCSRAFSLPFVNLADVAPPLRRFVHAAYRMDGALLRRWPSLAPFAGVRVFALRK